MRPPIGEDFARDGPIATAVTDQFIEGGTAQTAAWNQHRNGLEEIRFAGTIGAGENDGGSVDVQPEVGVIAKVLEGEPPDGEHVGWSMHSRYMGIAEPVFTGAGREIRHASA